ncbi:MAG TPA: hypothetical protein VKQ36_10275 [Ktedonobacterales bacterium]|nr:hypothetical protein [Ktedonobacterales bacterium]
MGTNIMMCAEQRVDSQWRLLGPLIDNPDYDPAENPEEPRLKPVEIYDVRNYDLFSILADVRNASDGPGRLDVIAPPRGMPPDLSPEISAWVSCFDSDSLQTPSWLTLRELLAFDWEHVSNHPTYDQLAGTYVVDALVRDSSGALVYHLARIEPLAGDEFLARPPSPHATYATYAELAGKKFMEGVLRPLQEAGDPDDVRIVFWFW